MKFEISVVLLLVIACMLGYVTYQSTASESHGGYSKG